MASFHPATDLNNAQWSRSKAEQFGTLALANNYLLVVIAILAAALAVLGWEVWRNTQAIVQFQPIVVRINDLGNAQAVSASAGHIPGVSSLRRSFNHSLVGWVPITQEIVNCVVGDGEGVYHLNRDFRSPSIRGSKAVSAADTGIRLCEHI